MKKTQSSIKKFSNRAVVYMRGKDFGAALISLEDVPKVEGIPWFLTNQGYASCRRMPSPKRIMMHRLIMGAPDGMCVDHINHNKLDNRRQNLRIVTKAFNNHHRKNRSELRGTEPGYNGKWSAYISINNKKKSLGTYATREEAIQARRAAEREIHGDPR